MTPAQPHASTVALTPDEDAARWQAAKQLRQQRPGWVVIWLARTGQYRAYPLFKAPFTPMAGASASASADG